MLVCTIGDALLDVIVRLEASIALDTDTYGRTHTGAGGQAANVAAWVAALGGRARFIGKRAHDAAGRIVGEELLEHGVEVLGPVAERGTGTVVSIATQDGRRTMLSDRGIAPEFRVEELDAAWLRGCDALHVPGYSIARSPLRETALAAARHAPTVTFDASSTAAIAAAGRQAYGEALSELRPSVVFANEAEASLIDAGEAPTLVVKRGARGCIVRSDGRERAYEPRRADVVDSTGAGDAFAAGYLLGGPELALEAAARCVGAMGAMP